RRVVPPAVADSSIAADDRSSLATAGGTTRRPGTVPARSSRWLWSVACRYRGLSESTLRKNGDAARMFLEWLGTRAGDSLRQLGVRDIDGYLSWRLPRLRRA